MELCLLLSLLLLSKACILSSAAADDENNEKLGPDSPPDVGECTQDSCPGFGGPKTDGSEVGANDDDITVENHGLVEVDSYSFLGSLKDTCFSAVNTVKDTVYDNVAQGTEKFAETVREVFKGELAILFQSIGSMLAKAFLSPDSLLYYLGEQAMSITLLLLCLLLTYIVLQFRLCSFIFILAFNSTVFLLHHITGPMTMFQYLYDFGSLVLVALSWMAAYPYLTSGVLALYFLWKISWPLRALIRWSSHREGVPAIEEVRITVLALSERLTEIEERQVQMLELLKTLSEREADALNEPEAIETA